MLAAIIGLFLISSCAVSTDPRSSTDGATDSVVRAPVDTAINQAVSRGAFPFLYVRVERLDGQLIYEHGSVNSDFVSRQPTADSWMRLWSMSKSVTIAAILSLEEDGILNRTDQITRYIPEFSHLKVLSPDSGLGRCELNLREPSRIITIEDLLNHNDGFYYPFTEHDCLNKAMRNARLPEATSTDDLLNRIAQLPLHPGGVGDHQYGIGTTILGLLAERATGRSFDEIVTTHITGPLGVSDTLTYQLPAETPTYPRVTGVDGELRLASDTDLDIFGGPVPQYAPDTSIYLGGEGMVGTTRGYAKFLRLMGSMGRLDGVRILEEATVRDWYSPKTQLDSAYGHNGFNIWVTSGKVDGLPKQKPGLLVGGGYEGTAFWIDIEAGYVGLIMSQVHMPATDGVDEVARIRGLIYEHILEPGLSY